jgi:hypothetical protein
MNYEVKQSRHGREWIVEAFNPKGNGDVYVAEFSGPEAKERAAEYAAWKNSLDEHTAVASISPHSCLWPTVTDLPGTGETADPRPVVS